MEMERRVKYGISILLAFFLMLSVYYIAAPFLFPEKGKRAFFTKSHVPKECIAAKGFPPYEIHIIKGDGYDTYLSYNGMESGMYMVEGRVENGSYTCTLLKGIVDGNWIVENETRSIEVFTISGMKRLEVWK